MVRKIFNSGVKVNDKYFRTLVDINLDYLIEQEQAHKIIFS